MGMIDCKDVLANLSAYIDGDGSAELRRALEEHSAHCRRCRVIKDCTLGCVKMGGKFVLYDAATKKTYKLDDQQKPVQFAGEKVKVTGTYDEATGTINVVKIAAAS